MSGGFFRGTSAEQDTRFSNKQAKLMKSQKFAPELEHLVDVSKVKMDVIKPWIAKRATELLGFEDEVLINFIYELLDKKEINGKEVQISLTGFMEKHTGKFMKELWILLLSAQSNASGVPQQFLDAKEEETRKKKEELDRIGNEIQKRKEKGSREFDEQNIRMDGGVGEDSGVEPNSKLVPAKDSGGHSNDGDESVRRNGVRGRIRTSRSPLSEDHTRLNHRDSRSPLSEDHPLSNRRRAPSRSVSRSNSSSRSYSDKEERNRSRSISRSPRRRRRSMSPRRTHRSPGRSSSIPRRRSTPRDSLSPRRKSPRRRSISRTHHRSPSAYRRRVHSPRHRRSGSPSRRRSPLRRRSRSPYRHRSRSPRRRRSPSLRRRRSPSPLRRRRSPSPWRRRSPSPRRWRSPSPLRRRGRRSSSSPSPASVSPYKRRSLSAGHRSPSPKRHKSPIMGRCRRSSSPESYSSASPTGQRPPPNGRKSPVLSRSPSLSPRGRTRDGERRSPTLLSRKGPRSRTPSKGHKRLDYTGRQNPISISPQRDAKVEEYMHKTDLSEHSSPRKSPSYSSSPPPSKNQTPPKERRQKGGLSTLNGRGSPVTEARESRPPHSGSHLSEDDEVKNSRRHEEYKTKSAPRSSLSRSKRTDSPKMSAGLHQDDDIDLRKRSEAVNSEGGFRREAPASKRSNNDITFCSDGPQLSPSRDSKKTDKNISQSDEVKESVESQPPPTKMNKEKRKNLRPDISESDGSLQREALDSGKRKQRGSSRHDVESDYSSYDSELEKRKEIKKRRKEEKKLRKEERRRRREDRRRRKEEKRSLKRKHRSRDSESDFGSEKDENYGIVAKGKVSHSSDHEEAETEKRRLEIELREKALQSFRAKRGVNH